MRGRLYLIAPQKEGLLKGNPYSLLYLAEWARRHSSCDSIAIVDDIDEIPADSYAGISVTTPTYNIGLEIAKKLKEKNVKTILGGYHTKGQGRIIAENHPEIEFIVEGEGEKALINILEGKAERIVYSTPLSAEELDSISIADLIKLSPSYFKEAKQF